MKNKRTIIKISIIVLLVGVVSFIIYAAVSNKFFFVNKKENGKEKKPVEKEPIIPTPKLKIFDLDSKTRPIAVMVDNERGAWPQAGLQEAFLVYEIIVEGGETRFLALFKDTTTKMIGPIRSARHYFLDYALENEAIFTHYGFSPQAQRDIGLLGVNNISGTQGDSSVFWREKVITTNWQNCFTSIAKIETRIEDKRYRTETKGKPLLNYSIDPVDLSTTTDVQVANKVTIPFSRTHTVVYDYDSITQLYKRSMRGKPHVDRITGLQYTTKNIIVYNVRNYPLNDEPGKGRQGVENIGSGTGYFITNGYSIPMKWEKTSRSSKTTYKDASGQEIKVNDGNTFIELEPLDRRTTFE